MPLHAGSRLGPYEIVAPLGAGGMGEVYRARDRKLQRDVAIKILPEALSADPERLARFKREAHLLASLNHPNIAHIYGFEDSTGTPALVMELVEGPTLANRLGYGPIPFDDALQIARQISEALESAHEQGIIHRDLKPANVKVRDDGTVKVLDFGLAKALQPAGGSPGSSQSPTITALAMTQAGVVIGTAAYMSPEQAKGRAADKRADVWAFGCVLYEMLTGRRAFDGGDLSLTLLAVMMNAPDWDALPSSTSFGLRRLLRQCLEKDPRRRLQAMGDARVQIEDLLADSSQDIVTWPTVRAMPLWRRVALPAAATGLAASLATAGFVWFVARPTVMQPRVARLHITLPSTTALTINGLSRDLAITPDGSRVVYVGANGTTLFVRPIDQLEATPLISGGTPRDPFVSPDGQWVGFFDGTVTLKKVAITGGAAVPLARLSAAEQGATWASDDTIIFATSATTTGLLRVSAGGGEASVLTRPDRERGEAGHRWPELLPDGQTVLFTVATTGDGLNANSIAALDLRSGRMRTLLQGGSQAQYVRSGHLVYAAAGTLRAVRFDLASGTVVGPSTLAVPHVRTIGFGAVDAMLSGDGTLVYVAASAGTGPENALVWVDRQGRETPVVAPPRAYFSPRISPDGTRVAVTAFDQESDIWVLDLARAALTRVTSDPGTHAFPVWMPDGRRVVFGSNRAGAFNLFSQAADGSGRAERLIESPNSQTPTAISPDGMLLVFTEYSAKTAGDVMALRLDGTHDVRALVQSSFDERNGIMSPDGRWLAYEADDSGAFEIYVRPFPDVARERWRVSTGGGTRPLWGRDGKELFYHAFDGALMRVSLAGGPAWTAGVPMKVLEGRYAVGSSSNIFRNYDIVADGQRFLMLKTAGSNATEVMPQIVVIEHFDEELKRLVPAK